MLDEQGGVPDWVPEGLETAYRATQLTISDTAAMSVVVADRAFGGMFIDDEGLHIAMTDGSIDRQSIPLLFSEPDLVHVESAQWTFDTLRAVEDRVIEGWTGRDSSLGTLSYVRMDEQRNLVDIVVASNTSAVMDWAEAHLPAGTYRVIQAEQLGFEPPTRRLPGQASTNEESTLDGATSWAEHQVLGFADCSNRASAPPRAATSPATRPREWLVPVHDSLQGDRPANRRHRVLDQRALQRTRHQAR